MGVIATSACKLVFVEPKTVEYTGSDPLAFVISANLRRRHLNETQRGLVAARLANMQRGGKEANPSNGGIALVSQKEAAKLLNVSPKTVERSVKLIKGGVPELVTAAEQGKVKVSKAVAFGDKPESERQLLISKCDGVVKAARNLGGGSGGGGNPESYDNVEKKLLAELEKMNPETAEAAAQKTINKLAAMVKAKMSGKHNLKLAA